MAGLPTFATPRLATERAADGALLLRSTEPLRPHEDHLGQMLRHWARQTPDAVLATDSTGATLTYGAATAAAEGLGQAMLDRGAGADRPVLVLSGNSVAHLQVTLACYTAGIPVVPASVAYSLQSADHRQLRAMVELVGPGLVFAEQAEPFAAALDVATATGAGAIVAEGHRDGAHRLADLVATPAGPQVRDAFAAITPDSIAKILFTSGSTGVPKGVLNTHRMLCANQQMMRQAWPFLVAEPPVLVDWLPWSHTFGGNHNMHMALANGGTIRIDDGKPAPGLFERTVEACRRAAPTVYFNVPAGYAMLVPRLEADRSFARHFLSRLRLLFYAGAALPQSLWDRLERLVAEVADHPVPLTSSWGATETSPATISAHFAGSRCGCIGVPLPGVTVKLAPVGRKHEIRAAGPNITPGYHGRPELNADAFDEDGFYRSGDAAVFVDPDDPARGLLFDGRIAEDFKLTTGTWVSVATVKGALLSAAGVLSDVVIAGHDMDDVTALGWLNAVEARKVCGLDETADVPPDHPALRAHLGRALAAMNRDAGSAGRVTRLLLCTEPPQLDAGEITDKGYLNQGVVLQRRAALVERLYAPAPDPDVIRAPAS